MKATLVVLIAIPIAASAAIASRKPPAPEFQTSDRCVACHNGLLAPSGEDVSIGFDWRASMMANSSRDPYWQASVRREAIDHPESKAAIEDECSICHMPITGYEARGRGQRGEVFSLYPIQLRLQGNFMNVFSFIHDTEALPRMSRVRSITIHSEPKEAGLVTVDLGMDLYFSPDL